MIFSIAWGTATISFMLAVGEGLRMAFAKKVSNGGHVTLVVQPGTTSKSFHGFPKGTPTKIQKESIPQLDKLPGVLSISVEKSFTASVRRGKRNSYANPLAVTPNYAYVKHIVIQKGGRFLNLDDSRHTKKVIFIGSSVRKWLFPKIENPVGMSIMLGQEPFDIIGVVDSSGAGSGFGSNSASNVYIPLSTYEVLSGSHKIGMLTLLLRSPSAVASAKKSTRRILASYGSFSKDDTSAISFESSAESAKTMNVFLLGFQIFLGIIGFITLVISGVGISNVMFMSIKRATRIIGMQMAIGATQRTIRLHYFLESLLVTLAGGVLGLLVTSGLIGIFEIIPIHSASYIAMGSPVPILSWGVFFAVIIVLGVIGFFASFFPARKAAATNPAIALRNEG